MLPSESSGKLLAEGPQLLWKQPAYLHMGTEVHQWQGEEQSCPRKKANLPLVRTHPTVLTTSPSVANSVNTKASTLNRLGSFGCSLGLPRPRSANTLEKALRGKERQERHRTGEGRGLPGQKEAEGPPHRSPACPIRRVLGPPIQKEFEKQGPDDALGTDPKLDARAQVQWCLWLRTQLQQGLPYNL